MEHNYTKTLVGKIQAAIIAPTIPLIVLGLYLDYSKGKEPSLYGLLISLFGLMLFLKAKISVIKSGKLISFGCDLMDQRNTFFYFFGWVIMIAGYFLSWV